MQPVYKIWSLCKFVLGVFLICFNYLDSGPGFGELYDRFLTFFTSIAVSDYRLWYAF